MIWLIALVQNSIILKAIAFLSPFAHIAMSGNDQSLSRETEAVSLSPRPIGHR